MSQQDVSKDDLAGMIQKGFLEMNEKFDMVNHRLERVEVGQEKLGREVNHLGFLVTELVRRDEFNDLKKRVELLEAK